MRHTTLSILLLSGQFVSFVFAAITYKACTKAQSDLIDTAITDAIDIAENARDRLATSPMKPTTRSLWDNLFLPADLSTVKAVFNEIMAARQTTLDITIYCSEAHVVMNTKSGYYEDTDFHSPTKPVIAIPLGQSPQDMAMNPRPKPGARSSYVVHGFNNDVAGDFTNQVHIVLDPAALGPSSASHDRRTLKTIVMDGLDPAYGGFLEKIRPLEVTILHELTHALGGLLAPNNGRMRFNDGPQKDTYGWDRCQKLRWHPVNDARFKPKWTADSYAQLAMGLELQIQSKSTYWDTGVVDPVTLRPPIAVVKGPAP